MSGRRLANVLRIALALAAGSALLQAGPTAAQSAGPPLSGIQGRAAASGIRALYEPEGLLPVSPLVEIGAPDALATIASGPATFARASVLDPGDIIANPAAILSQLDPNFPTDLLLPYPYRVTASSGLGVPTAESNPAPGLHARVEVTPTGSNARASMPAAIAPAVVTFGTVSSTATTHTDGPTATVTARTEVSDFNLLGILRIQSIVSEATATSDGTGTEVSGGTTIVGATVLGQPVTIDATGVHAGPGPSGPQSPSLLGPGGLLGPDGLLGGLLGGDQGLFGALAALGIEVTVAGPAVLEGGSSGQVTAGGLVVSFDLSEQDLPLLGQLLDALPPLDAPIPGLPGPEDLIAIVRARHLGSIEVARASVSLTTRPAIVVPPLEPQAPVASTPGGGAVAPPPFTGAPGGTVGATPAPIVGAPTGGSAPTPVQREESSTTGLAPGIGAAAALALLLQPVFGRWLAGAATGILGAADVCPREDL